MVYNLHVIKQEGNSPKELKMKYTVKYRKQKQDAFANVGEPSAVYPTKGGGRRMNEYKVKKALECCSVVGFETSCSDCPYCYRCNDLPRDALNIITEQEKEIEQLLRERNGYAETLAKEQEACVECELEQSWELFARDKEIDRLRAESKRFENNTKSVLEIEKKNVVKEFAEKVKDEFIKSANIQDSITAKKLFRDICPVKVDKVLKKFIIVIG